MPLDRDEIIRRQQLSAEAWRLRRREEWQAQYQEACDKRYWSRGPCCAGCDHWASESSLTGTCNANGMVSGLDVIRSMGLTFCSYIPPPGFPYTEADFHCGKFRDDFDWSTLDADYLERIGAMKRGVLRDKPRR